MNQICNNDNYFSKVILAMETGIIPPNINFKTPKQEIKSLIDGRIKVVTDPTPWKGGYAGVNSFGFGGANAHVLLKSNTKEKINKGAPKDDLPRLVVVSGRTDEAVSTILSDVRHSFFIPQSTRKYIFHCKAHANVGAKNIY